MKKSMLFALVLPVMMISVHIFAAGPDANTWLQRFGQLTFEERTEIIDVLKDLNTYYYNAMVAADPKGNPLLKDFAVDERDIAEENYKKRLPQLSAKAYETFQASALTIDKSKTKLDDIKAFYEVVYSFWGPAFDTWAPEAWKAGEARLASLAAARKAREETNTKYEAAKTSFMNTIFPTVTQQISTGSSIQGDQISVTNVITGEFDPNYRPLILAAVYDRESKFIGNDIFHRKGDIFTIPLTKDATMIRPKKGNPYLLFRIFTYKELFDYFFNQYLQIREGKKNWDERRNKIIQELGIVALDFEAKFFMDHKDDFENFVARHKAKLFQLLLPANTTQMPLSSYYIPKAYALSLGKGTGVDGEGKDYYLYQSGSEIKSKISPTDAEGSPKDKKAEDVKY